MNCEVIGGFGEFVKDSATGKSTISDAVFHKENVPVIGTVQETADAVLNKTNEKMKDFYTEMQIADLIERQEIYNSKLLMELVPGARLSDGSDVYFIPVSAERMQDPLFSFLKDQKCVMMGSVVGFQNNDPQLHTLFINSYGHLVGNDRLKKSIGQIVYTSPLAYFYDNCQEKLRTDGTDIYVEDKGLIVKVSYIVLRFKDHVTNNCDVQECEYAEVLNTAEPKDLLNALIVHFNDVHDSNTQKIGQIMWENINIAAIRDTLRQIQVQGTYYPECCTTCRKDENYEN